jgi:hypothetical protein
MASRTLKKWLDDDFFHRRRPNARTAHRTVTQPSDGSLPDPSPNRPCPSSMPTTSSRTSASTTLFPGDPRHRLHLRQAAEEEGDDTEWNDVFATFESKTINGVKALVSRDTAYVNGVLAEDTLDYFRPGQAGQRLVPRRADLCLPVRR